jgi:hypothetical protein
MKTLPIFNIKEMPLLINGWAPTGDALEKIDLNYIEFIAIPKERRRNEGNRIQCRQYRA